jgi:hypothetical protein
MSVAAVEDADQAVGQRAESLVVCLTTSSVFVVVAPSTWRPSQRRVRPAEAGIDEMAVAHDTSEYGVACARRACDRRRPSAGLTCLGIAVRSGIVTKLGQRSDTGPRPGKLATISASACCSKALVSSVSSVVICVFSAPIRCTIVGLSSHRDCGDPSAAVAPYWSNWWAIRRPRSATEAPGTLRERCQGD